MTKEEFTQWKENPTTVEVMSIITEVRRNYVERLIYGGTLNNSNLAETGRMVGAIQAFDYLLDIQFDGGGND